MVNMSAKFDEDEHSGFTGLVFIVSTSLFPYMCVYHYMSIVTLTFDLQNR